jgi:hypothetical protein
MKKQYDVIVVMPLGPGSEKDFITDSLKSVEFYMSCSYKIILLDNSQKNTGYTIQADFPEADVVIANKAKGKMGGQYVNLCYAFKYAIDKYDFKLLLRMDDDALITGADPQLQAMQILDSNPNAGMIGWHIKGRYAKDCFGNTHDNIYCRNTLIAGAYTWKFIKRPLVNYTLRGLLEKAFRNGYELGENIQGGAYFITYKCIQKMDEAGLLPVQRLKNAILCEDHIFSLVTKVVGMDLCDLSAVGQPFGMAWRGLPVAPEKIYAEKKKIIHSVRFWADMKEHQVREYFNNCRREELLIRVGQRKQPA